MAIKQKHYLFRLPVYGQRVLFIYFNNHKYAQKILDKYGVDETVDNLCAGFVNNVDLENEGKLSRLFYIVVRHDNNEKELDNTIDHETLHLTQDILEYVGIHFKKGHANEPYAYLKSWLNEHIKEKIYGRTKKSKGRTKRK